MVTDLQSTTTEKRLKVGAGTNKGWFGRNSNDDDGKNDPWISLKRIPFLSLYRYAEPFDYILLTIGILLSLAEGFPQALQSIIFKSLTDTLIEGQAKWGTEDFNESEFRNGTITAIYKYLQYGISVLILAVVSMAYWHTVCERQIHQIRKHYLAAVLRQDMSWFDVHPSGELITKMFNDIDRMKDGIGDKVGILFSYGSTFVGGLIVAFICRMTVIMLAFMPVLVGLTAFLTRSASASVRRELRAYQKAGAVVEEVITGIRTVIAFNGQEKEIKRYEDELNKGSEFGRRKALFIAIGTGWLFCLIFIAMGITFW